MVDQIRRGRRYKFLGELVTVTQIIAADKWRPSIVTFRSTFPEVKSATLKFFKSNAKNLRES